MVYRYPSYACSICSVTSCFLDVVTRRSRLRPHLSILPQMFVNTPMSPSRTCQTIRHQFYSCLRGSEILFISPNSTIVVNQPSMPPKLTHHAFIHTSYHLKPITFPTQVLKTHRFVSSLLFIRQTPTPYHVQGLPGFCLLASSALDLTINARARTVPDSRNL